MLIDELGRKLNVNWSSMNNIAENASFLLQDIHLPVVLQSSFVDFFIPSISMHLKKLVTSFEGFHFLFTPFILPVRFPLCSNLVKGFTITSMNVFIFEILWSNPICVFMGNVMLNLQWNILLVSFHFKDYVQNYVNKSNSSSSSNLLIRNFYMKLFFYQRIVYDNVQRYAVFVFSYGVW